MRPDRFEGIEIVQPPRALIRGHLLTNFLFSNDQSDLVDSDSLLERGIVDSIGVIDLVAFLENEFSFSMELEDITPDNIDSVDSICRFLFTKGVQL